MELQGASREREMRDILPPTGDCPICGGDGFLIGDDDAEIQCETCNGTGQRQPADQAA